MRMTLNVHFFVFQLEFCTIERESFCGE
jgi:hypothetical protein